MYADGRARADKDNSRAICRPNKKRCGICYCKISVCKRYHLENIAAHFCVPIEKTLAVGDTKSDICMIQRAGIGIAFMPKDNEIKKASDKIISEPDLLKVLEFAV